ncbi:TetR/AcrR family transcriptional regulator [Alkalibacter rhizosphaerae]|uniref:TetR/AcrR family transcriptional regulator n=1 Tax=Alkalibacter rhizosphaerae TaxID=2815577 RepID=A0A975AHF2_9FIRM|nr:TetR/AcrR family transcriptional regulator [Alkalibacter rhizosphaerae]QSX07554.1 TetR/AcrR family transcriptional regulator [Alkalibacter rhizosphaerae]
MELKKITAADKIYKAAKHLFYEHGYYGTTTRDITAKSKTNLGLIKYYFNSKKVLAYKMLKEIVDEVSGSVDKHLNHFEDPLLYAMTYTNAFLNLIFNDPRVESFIVEAFSDEIMEDLDEAFYRSNLYTLNLLILEKNQFAPEFGVHQTIQLNFYTYHNTIKSLGRMRLKGKLILSDDQFRHFVLKTTYFGLGVDVDQEVERMEKSYKISKEIEQENVRIQNPKQIFMS